MREPWVKNRAQIQTTPARAALLDIVEAGFDAIDTEAVVTRTVRLLHDTLTLDGRAFNLKDYRHVYVLGFGKASGRAAVALERVLGERITDGVVISTKAAPTERIRTYEGTHPLPSERNVAVARRMEELIGNVKAEDLVICLVSGGGSALLCWTDEERAQGAALYQSYLKTGDDIKGLNTVRKHLSQVKGGGLAKMLYPATVASLIFSDIAGDGYHLVDSGPTYLDESTVAEAQAIINRYGLGNFRLTETPKDPKYFERVYNLPVLSNAIALERMAQRARELGLSANVLSAELFEPAQETLERLMAAAAPGTVVLAGSEIKLVVDKPGGSGGRNTYLALLGMEQIGPTDTFAAVASDGLDNSPAAGGMVDASSRERAAALPLNAADYLSRFDSYTALERLGHELIQTGPTEANVSDFLLLYRS